MNKIAKIAATAAVVLATATPAFASTSVSNQAFVWNNVHTNSNSGRNAIVGFVVAGGSITTGPATSNSLVVNDVNHTNASNGFFGLGSTSVGNNAVVLNNVRTNSNSGQNLVAGAVVVGGSVNAGGSNSGAGVVNVVNTTVTH